MLRIACLVLLIAGVAARAAETRSPDRNRIGSQDSLSSSASSAMAEEPREKHRMDLGCKPDKTIEFWKGEDHGFFHISKGGRKMFENVLVKTDAFLVKHGYLTGPNNVATWTAMAVKSQKPIP